jgi:hypothetical protein
MEKRQDSDPWRFYGWTGAPAPALPWRDRWEARFRYLQDIPHASWVQCKRWWALSPGQKAYSVLAVPTAAWSWCRNWWNAPRKEYRSFWYSLDLFVPAINMETEKYWQPKERHWFLWFWLRMQRAAGWVIIPIGLAALTGIIKN